MNINQIEPGMKIRIFDWRDWPGCHRPHHWSEAMDSWIHEVLTVRSVRQLGGRDGKIHVLENDFWWYTTDIEEERGAL